ncbi:Alpha beta hydrolase [Colletotrichum higginsianum IMI 349063]|uniref:Alpha beta hydrolase n=2 Tax=Colletotrichum higginsianum TaxID=80884 RepID=A0A1B7XSP6_COLHI|nr:Alpha beta hydrolase [Colletotrichum higginsianum IMI 349063]OBR02767.1 Alpha beta hydrolase [Colletotrichum higginsianum IMI 349063]
MLHQQTASTLVNGSRLKLASSFITTSTTATVKSPAPSVRASSEDSVPRRSHQTMAAAAAPPAAPTATTRPPGTYFPLGYKDAVYQWWSSVTPQQAERNVLSHIPYLKEARENASLDSDKHDPFGPRVWKSQMVELSGKDRALNEYSIERVGEEVDNNLVIIHGYGAGLGFFYKNFEPLSRPKGWKLYALDMLGMGNSTRPPFKVTAKDQQGKTAEAEAWFIDALEEWRKKRNIDKFTLIGHSLGGYLSVAYALKYPGHLKKLILASPVGIPEDPYAVNAAMPEPEESTFQNEFTQDQNTVTNDDRNSMTSRASKSGAKNSNNAPKRPLPGWLVWLWDANVSPFSIVRFTGPLGPRFVSGWTSRRFNHLPPAESQSLHDYAFSIFRQRGSGEYALPYILAPGAFARSPMVNRIDGVGRQIIEKNGEKLKETGVPIVMMYGENDWMDVAGGYAAEEKLKQAKMQALLKGTDEEKRRENGSAKVLIVNKAGHHLYLDNASQFNDYILKEMEETQNSKL